PGWTAPVAATATPTAAAIPPVMALTMTGSIRSRAGAARVRCARNGRSTTVTTVTPRIPSPKPTRAREACAGRLIPVGTLMQSGSVADGTAADADPACGESRLNRVITP